MAGPSGATPNLLLPYPTPDDSVDVPRDVGALANSIDTLGLVPVGTIAMWPTAVPPLGWLLCQGQNNISAGQYPKLAAVLGQSGGMVSMPDYRDVFPVGAGNTALGSRGGVSSVTLSTAQMPSHGHGVNDPSHVHGMSAAGTHSHGGATAARDRTQNHGHTLGHWTAGQYQSAGTILGYGFDVGTTATDPADHLHGIYADGNHAHSIDARYTGISIAANGSGQAHENRPPFAAINFIIKAG